MATYSLFSQSKGNFFEETLKGRTTKLKTRMFSECNLCVCNILYRKRTQEKEEEQKKTNQSLVCLLLDNNSSKSIKE